MAQEIHTQLCCDRLSCGYISSSDSIPYTHINIHKHKHTHINTIKTEHAYIGNGIVCKGTDWIVRRGISSIIVGLIGSFSPWPDLHFTPKYEVVRILLKYACHRRWWFGELSEIYPSETVPLGSYVTLINRFLLFFCLMAAFRCHMYIISVFWVKMIS